MQKKQYMAFNDGDPVFIQKRYFNILRNYNGWSFILSKKHADKLNKKEKFTVYELTPMQTPEKIQKLKRAKRKWKRGERNENHNRSNARGSKRIAPSYWE